MDKKKLAAKILGTVFVVVAAALQSPIIAGHAGAHQALELLLSVLGGLGFGVMPAAFGGKAVAASDPGPVDGAK